MSIIIILSYNETLEQYSWSELREVIGNKFGQNNRLYQYQQYAKPLLFSRAGARGLGSLQVCPGEGGPERGRLSRGHDTTGESQDL